MVALRESDWIHWIVFDSTDLIQSVKNNQAGLREFVRNRLISHVGCVVGQIKATRPSQA